MRSWSHTVMKLDISHYSSVEPDVPVEERVYSISILFYPMETEDLYLYYGP